MPNHLIHSTSPYLLQHAHNPVDWYPWSEEALERAKKQDKLLIVSIGYAACHWCHVMEHESFEDEEVAEVMNAHFVSIKVDREERPDIDQTYMTAAQLISGRGGWPLNVVCLPDTRPIFAGTYFRKEQWIAQLMHLAKLYKTQREEVIKVAEHLEKGIKDMGFSGMKLQSGTFSPKMLEDSYLSIIQKIDFEEGGTQGAPKFPMPVIYQFLLRYHYHSNSLSALQAVEITLDKMAQGGIYDQVGGGFARYSVDGVWRVPHFEKMLYDNGQLISLYAEAFQQMKKERYKEVVYQSIDFVLRDMRSPEGGFYSALDADSEGVEGKFYLFTTEELKEILDTDAPALIDYYNATPEGNWEHSNILYITDDIETIAKRHGLKTTELKETIQTAKQKLLATRNTRVRPALDDKILCAWNALMLKGLVDAYRAFGEKRFLEAALANANFIEKKLLQEDGRLFRNFKNGRASINAFLEDYSFTIEAFIALYQVTFEAKWLSLAEKMTTYTIAHFYDEESKLFFFTSKLDKAIISRSSELTDNVIPSPNSSMAKALFLLGQLLYEDKYLSLSETMLRQIAANIAPNAAFMANWATLLFLHTSDQYQLSILGDNALEIQHAFDKVFLPNVVFAGDTTESELPALAHKYVTGENLIYICKNKACDAPVHSVEEALDIIRK